MKNMENDEDLLISLELQNFMDASQKKQSDQQRPQRLINQLTKIKNPVNLIQVATPETGQVFGHPQPAVLNRGRQMQQINQDLAQQLAISNSSQLAKVQVATPGTGQVFGNQQSDNSEQYRVKGATLSDLRKQRRRIQTNNEEVTASRQLRPSDQNLKQQLIQVGSSGSLIQVASPGAGQVFGHQQSDDSEQQQVKVEYHHGEVVARHQLRPSDQNLEQQLIQVGSSGNLIQVASPGAGQVFGHQQSDDFDENTGRRQLRPSDQNLKQQLTQVGSTGNLIQVASPGAGQVFGHQQSDDSEQQQVKVEYHHGEVVARHQLRPSDQNLEQQLIQVGSSGNLIQVASPGAGQVFGHQQSDVKF
ncbi:putative mediator of RNA polymerase II transcription subunit 26 isoform X2 [Culex quinquefasciatus]|uniref:putative mediator of RNA polymerase II transcription subunit 26 isoform X2 n=1 Tax=Culex quinquefasciatus TaxID=7176 RepID=UPI0018E2A377|nr:putative mediator of RNA polymerase II transcription subunit 26 isoform X2 [Culex quinquefasciatus]